MSKERDRKLRNILEAENLRYENLVRTGGLDKL